MLMVQSPTYTFSNGHFWAGDLQLHGAEAVQAGITILRAYDVCPAELAAMTAELIAEDSAKNTRICRLETELDTARENYSHKAEELETLARDALATCDALRIGTDVGYMPSVQELRGKTLRALGRRTNPIEPCRRVAEEV